MRTPINLSNLSCLSYGQGFTHWLYRDDEPLNSGAILEWPAVVRRYPVSVDGLGSIINDGDLVTIVHVEAHRTSMHYLWRNSLGEFHLYPIT